jgi:pilus assembly protein FimV
VESANDSKGFTHDGTLIVSPEQQRKAAEPEPSMGIEFSMDDKLESSSAPGGNSAVAEKPAEATGAGMPMLEPDFKLDFNVSGAETAAAEVPALKLDEISLNFEEGPGAVAPPAESGTRDDHWYDVQTKFDLAKAYQEMGEKGGAREILQEVIKEGDAGQRAEAQKLLESLD